MRAFISAIEKGAKALFWRWVQPSPSGRSPGPVRSLLALRPDRLGDFILTAPALSYLESRLPPGGRLTLVAGERNEELARFLFPRARIWTARPGPFQKLLLFLRLRSSSFDAVLDFHSYPFSTTSALMALLPAAARRIGFWAGGGEGAASRRVFPQGLEAPPEALHESQKSFLLARKLFPGKARAKAVLSLPKIPLPVRKKADSFAGRSGLGREGKWVALHPCLQKKDNRWPPERYLELIEDLRSSGIRVLLVQGRGEEAGFRAFLRDLGNRKGVFPLPGSGLLLILECLRRVDLFVGGDSGLTHLASLATRVLALFGPSDPGRWGPLGSGPGGPWVIRGRGGDCGSITTGEVAAKVAKILGTGQRAR